MMYSCFVNVFEWRNRVGYINCTHFFAIAVQWRLLVFPREKKNNNITRFSLFPCNYFSHYAGGKKSGGVPGEPKRFRFEYPLPLVFGSKKKEEETQLLFGR